MNFSQPSTHSHERGFTLVEAVIGLMILVLAASVVFFALSQMNRQASIARLYTAAEFLVQQQIDEIQTDTPFIPQNSQIPSELAVGTVTTNPTISAVDINPSTSSTTYNVMLTGTMTSTVSNISNSGLSEYAYLAQIQLTYSYRNTKYEVDAWTIRGSDQ